MYSILKIVIEKLFLFQMNLMYFLFLKSLESKLRIGVVHALLQTIFDELHEKTVLEITKIKRVSKYGSIWSTDAGFEQC